MSFICIIYRFFILLYYFGQIHLIPQLNQCVPFKMQSYVALFFYKSNIVFETTLSEYESMEAECISQKTKLISNDPKVVFLDAKIEMK